VNDGPPFENLKQNAHWPPKPREGGQRFKGRLFLKHQLLFIIKKNFMAKVGSSIFDIQGKLGDLVYYRYRGKSFVKRASKRISSSLSPGQLEHQAKFALIANFLRPLHDFLKVTYMKNRNKTGYRRAFAAIYQEALTGTYPSFSVDYPKVRLGNGNLSGAGNPTVHSPDPGRLVFSWDENSFGNTGMSSDEFYVAIYSEQLKQWTYNFKNAARYKKFCRVDAANFSGTRVHIYIGFVSADGKRSSTPFYAGALTVS
jgi:hypothetical protein